MHAKCLDPDLFCLQNVYCMQNHTPFAKHLFWNIILPFRQKTLFHNFVEKLIHILELKKAKGSKEMPKGDKKANCCSSNTQKSKQCNRINKVILLYFIFLKTPIIAARSIHKSIAVLSIHLFLRPGTSFRKERIENILEVTLIPAMFCSENSETNWTESKNKVVL